MMGAWGYPNSVRDTSREAFADNQPKFKTMGDRIVWHMRSRGGAFTRAELARDLGISTSTMSGRVNDLLKNSRVRELAERRRCSVTGNRVRGLVAA